MGHDSERAAMIYHHEARGSDKAITDTIELTSGPSSTTRATATMA